jgi:hypothetical protein
MSSPEDVIRNSSRKAKQSTMIPQTGCQVTARVVHLDQLLSNEWIFPILETKKKKNTHVEETSMNLRHKARISGLLFDR